MSSSFATTRDRIRQGLSSGLSVPQAISGAYEKARLAALVRGDLGEYETLIGSSLPADIMAMGPEEALAELTRLDELSAKRGLSALEKQRLINVELRMEQFAGGPMPEQDWSYYEQLAKEVASKPPEPAYTGPAQTVDLTFHESKMGMWPLALAGLLFIAAKRIK